MGPGCGKEGRRVGVGGGGVVPGGGQRVKGGVEVQVDDVEPLACLGGEEVGKEKEEKGPKKGSKKKGKKQVGAGEVECLL